MGGLPPVAPAVGHTTQVRLNRDYYVRVGANDYSVDPSAIGRLVDVRAGLDEVVVTCAKTVVATHERSWASHQTITDPAHVATAAEIRRAFKARTASMRGPLAVAGTVVQERALGHYDEVFHLPAPPSPPSRPNLLVVQ